MINPRVSDISNFTDGRVVVSTIGKGPQGDTGPQGPIGPQGPQGPQGPTGSQGPKGDTGNTGPQGERGLQGLQGPKGDTGETGAKGDKGDQGEQGIQGPAATITVGTTTTGEPGTNASVINVGTTSAAVLNFTIPKGATGAQGPKGDTGNTGSQGPQGIQGPKGDTGEAGPQGIQGPKGDAGDTGPQGIQGPKGDTGDTGATGPQGPKGDTGDTGATGPQGPKGDTGNTGATGPQGPRGPQGEQGATGTAGTAATISVGTVSASQPGSTPSITNSGTSSSAIFDFVLPRGETGPQGPQADPSEILNLVYPVGAIYISVNNTNPSLLFGGTWEQIEDKFLLSAGNSHAAGSTGGAETDSITLSTSNMPSHTHTGPSHRHTGGLHSHGMSHNHNTYNGDRFVTVDESSTKSHYGIASPSSTAANRVYGTTGTGSHFSNTGITSQPQYNGSERSSTGEAGEVYTTYSGTGATGSTGSGTAFEVDTMPPYLAVYIWKRVA